MYDLFLARITCAALFLLACTVPARAESDFAALKFRPLGPSLPSGRMTAIAGSNRNPMLYFAGAAAGGLFKSSDGAMTWSALFQHEPVSAIGAVALDPRNDDVIWVGTGEANPRNDTTYGDGIYVSTDGGKRWEHRGLASSEQISSIIIDPRDSRTILVGVLGNTFSDSPNRGVYRTTDAGHTWKRTLYRGPQSGISDLAIDPSDPRHILAGVWQFRRLPWRIDSGGPIDGLYESNDGGVTWHEILEHGFPGSPRGRIGIAFSPSRPRHVIALVQSKAGQLWDSRDGGHSWTLLYSRMMVNERPFYFTHVIIDPRDDRHVFTLAALLAESHDGGHHFRDVQRMPHADHHSAWWSSDGERLILAQDGGLTLSNDGGRTFGWVTGGIPTTQIYHLGFDRQVPYRVCISIQDTHAYCGPSNSLDPVGITDRHWFEVNPSDGSAAWPDPIDPELIWTSFNFGSVGLFDTRTQQSLDVSPTVENYVNNWSIDNLPYRFNWTTDLALDSFDSGVYYGANVLFKTLDHGRSWSVISPDLTLNDKNHQRISGGPISYDVTGAEYYDTIVDIEPSNVKPGIIWVGTDDGLIQLSRDGGAHWTDVSIRGLRPYGRIAVAASTSNPAAAYAAVDRHFLGDRHPYVYVTEDFGTTWSPIAQGLPNDVFVRTIRPDPVNPTLIYLGNEKGLYVSFNAGHNWEPFPVELPTTPVYDIRVQPDFDDLLVGTHGRGLWILDNVSSIQRVDAARSSKGPYVFPVLPAYTFWYWNAQFGWNYDFTATTPRNIFAAENPPAGAIIDYYLPRRLDVAPKLTVRDGSGSKIATIDGTNSFGVNRVVWALADDPPAPFRQAKADWNKSAVPTGAPVVPGVYEVTLDPGDASTTRTFVVKPDPRAKWTQQDYQATHDFYAAIYRDLGALDQALDELVDSRRRLVPIAARSTLVGAQARELIARIDRLKALITVDPDDPLAGLAYANALREKLQTLSFGFGTSQGPPLAPHLAELKKLHNEVEAALDEYRALDKSIGRNGPGSTTGNSATSQ